MRYDDDDDQAAFRAEVRRFAAKTLAPHYQSDVKAAVFRRDLALDMARAKERGG